MNIAFSDAPTEFDLSVSNPKFDRFARTWLTDINVLQMSAAERGIYIMLTLLQDRDGFLIADNQLSRQCGVDIRTLEKFTNKYANLFLTDTDGKRKMMVPYYD